MSMIVLDIETTGLDPTRDEIVAVGFSDAYFYKPKIIVRRPGEPEEYLISRVIKALPDNLETIIGYNVGFDMDFLRFRSFYFDSVKVIDLYPLTKSYFGHSIKLRQAVLRLFGFDDDDDDGAMMPKLWREGRTDEIKKHLEADINRTWLLANFFMPMITWRVGGE